MALAALRGVQFLDRKLPRGDGIGRQMRGRKRRQITIGEFQIRMPLLPLGNYVAGQLAGNGVLAQNAGIDMQNLHVVSL